MTAPVPSSRMLIDVLCSSDGSSPCTARPNHAHQHQPQSTGEKERGGGEGKQAKALDGKEKQAVGDICETSLFFTSWKGGAMSTACILHGGLKGGGETEKSNKNLSDRHDYIIMCWLQIVARQGCTQRSTPETPAAIPKQRC